MTITVGLDSYRFHATHGYFDEEHHRTQPFVVSIKARLEKTFSIKSLHDSVDYGFLQKVVDDVFLNNNKPQRLLEHLASQIVSILAKEELIEAVWIRIEKPEAPLPHEGGVPYIELEWERETQI